MFQTAHGANQMTKLTSNESKILLIVNLNIYKQYYYKELEKRPLSNIF